jgi:hypothetical protein
MIPRSAFSWSLLKLLLLHYFGFDWQRRPVHIVHICRPEWSRCSYHTWPIHVFVSCVVTVFLEYQEIVSTTNFQFWIMSSRFRHQDFGNQFHQTSCMSTQHTPEEVYEQLFRLLTGFTPQAIADLDPVSIGQNHCHKTSHVQISCVGHWFVDAISKLHTPHRWLKIQWMCISWFLILLAHSTHCAVVIHQSLSWISESCWWTVCFTLRYIEEHLTWPEKKKIFFDVYLQENKKTTRIRR